jgi:hypothetical protein
MEVASSLFPGAVPPLEDIERLIEAGDIIFY